MKTIRLIKVFIMQNNIENPLDASMKVGLKVNEEKWPRHSSSD
jgi:hypothetical protein